MLNADLLRPIELKELGRGGEKDRSCIANISLRYEDYSNSDTIEHMIYYPADRL
jgi:hypothetical protein